MEEIKVIFERLTETATIPCKKGENEAGFDLFADEAVILKPGDWATVSTGIAWEPSTPHCYMQIKGRSGMAFMYGVESTNAGVIDSTYRGEIKVRVFNTSDKEYTILRGDRVAQGIILPLPKITVVEGKVGSSERGTNGFGSSGR